MKKIFSKIGLKLFVLLVLVALAVSSVIFGVAYVDMNGMVAYSSQVMKEMETDASSVAAEKILDQMEGSIERQASLSAENVDLMFRRVSGEIFEMSHAMEQFYDNREEESENGKIPPYPSDTYDQVPMGRGAIAKGVEVTEEIQKEQILTAKIEYMATGVFNSDRMLNNVLVGTETGIFYRYSRYNEYDEDYDARTRGWYRDALAKPGHMIWSGAYREKYGNLVVTCSRTFNDERNQVAGVIACDVLIENLVKELMEDATNHFGGYAFILGKDGKYIAHPDSNQESFCEDPLSDASPEMAEILQDMVAGNSGLQSLTLYNGHKDIDAMEYYAYAPITSTGWTYAIVVDSKTVLEPINEAMGRIDKTAVQAQNNLKKSAVKTVWKFIRTFLLCLIVIALLAFFMSVMFQRPIRRLVDGSHRIGEGDLNYRIPKRGSDELAMLASDFNAMAGNLKKYIAELTTVMEEKQRLGAEMDIAKRIQTDMLPRSFPAFPEYDCFDLYASMNPAREVGGDFYDFFMPDEEHLALVIADVSGKGVPAALFMAISMTLIKNETYTGLPVDVILTNVNKQLCRSNSADMFVSVWMGIVDLTTGKMACSNAGHEMPFIRRKDGSFQVFKDRHGLVLGGMDGIKYHRYDIELKPGDAIFVYTDGVPEANNAAQEMFGMERTEMALNRKPDANPEELLSEVKKAVEDFVEDAPQFDDLTMLCYTQKSLLKTEKWMCFTPDPSSVPEVAMYVEGVLEEADVPMKTANKISICLDELYSNVVNYSGAKKAEILCKVEAGEITLAIRDDGIPYDATQKEDPDVTASLEERQVGGLGIFIAKNLLDELRYERVDEQNVNIMKLKIK